MWCFSIRPSIQILGGFITLVIVPGKVARKHAVGFSPIVVKALLWGQRAHGILNHHGELLVHPQGFPCSNHERNYTRPSTGMKQIRQIQNVSKAVSPVHCSHYSIDLERWDTPTRLSGQWLSVLNLSHVMQYAQLITGLNSLRIQALYPARLGPERRGYTTYTQEHNGSNMQQRNIQPFWSAPHSGYKIYPKHQKQKCSSKNCEVFWSPQIYQFGSYNFSVLFLCAYRCSMTRRGRAQIRAPPRSAAIGSSILTGGPKAEKTEPDLGRGPNSSFLETSALMSLKYVINIYIYTYTPI